METVKKEGFKIIGIKTRTTNENGQLAKDIGQLWEKFMSEAIVDKIPNKVDTAIFSIYTNYEKDHTKPFDTILGCAVHTLDEIPQNMIGQEFDMGNYRKFIAKGDLTKNIVYNTWTEIWDTDLAREYSADFEIYGEKSQNTTNAEVEIFVAIK